MKANSYPWLAAGERNESERGQRSRGRNVGRLHSSTSDKSCRRDKRKRPGPQALGHPAKLLRRTKPVSSFFFFHFLQDFLCLQAGTAATGGPNPSGSVAECLLIP